MSPVNPSPTSSSDSSETHKLEPNPDPRDETAIADQHLARLEALRKRLGFIPTEQQLRALLPPSGLPRSGSPGPAL
jgi:hypothetical protein